MAETALGLEVELPRGLAALIAFLNVDSRPATIYRYARGEFKSQQSKPQQSKPQQASLQKLYANDALSSLQAQHKTIVADLELALKQGLDDHGIKEALMGHSLDSNPWEIRIWEDCFIAVHRMGSVEMNRCTNPSLKASDEGSIDWTQGETPSMTAWNKFCRSIDWSASSIGSMDSWPPILRHVVLAIMANPSPRLIIWGDRHTIIYNEACVQLFGRRHPEAMGSGADMLWATEWQPLRPLIDSGFRGSTTRKSNLSLSIIRDDFLEETYWDVTVLPIVGNDGRANGVMGELTETTMLVTQARRRNILAKLNDHISEVSTFRELWTAILEGLRASVEDVPFALVYDVMEDVLEDLGQSCDPPSGPTLIGKRCVLAGSFGIEETQLKASQAFYYKPRMDPVTGIMGACARVWETRRSMSLSARDGTLPVAFCSPVHGRGFGDPIREAHLSPIISAASGEVIAVLCIGLNPRTGDSSVYDLFLRFLVEFVEKAASLVSMPQEHRRAKKIADEMVASLAHQLQFMTLQAEKSEARFTRLAATAPTGMFMVDADGQALSVNNAYLDMVGISRDQYNSRRSGESILSDRIHEDDKAKFSERWKRVTVQKVPITVEFRLKKPWKSIDRSTGQEISGETWLLTTAFPEIDTDGKVVSVQGWLTDISHRKFSENLLSQRLKDALEYKRQTENFIDMTSHEMRNPLSAILQSADSIVSALNFSVSQSGTDAQLQPGLVEDIVDAAQTIILCAQHQKRIVDDVLTLSKLDADLLEIAPDKVRLPRLVEKALKMFEAELDRADIEAKLCIEPTYNDLAIDWVLLDPSRLLQVIINLLTNAIKFTRGAATRKIKICLGASLEKPTGRHHKVNFIPPRSSRRVQQDVPETCAGNDVYLQIGVYDTGKGLSQDEMKVLFQRFQQGSPKTYKHYGGSGLGLFISRELCELQGGQIGAASENGTTVFTFFVKAKRWMPERIEDEYQFPALHRFASASASPIAYSRRASLALEDSTSQLTRHVTADGTLEHEFHPLTTNRALSDPLRKQKIPIGGEVVAPDNMTEGNVLGKVTEDIILATSGQSNGENVLHVLIVEDNLINQKVLSKQLMRLGCIVHVANHGVECLEFLDRSTYCSATTPLSIILLDLEMPTMDGLTCIRHIRERQTSGQIIGHVPVIAVTANARSEQIALAIEAGMDSVVTKPFRIPELLPQMAHLVEELASP